MTLEQILGDVEIHEGSKDWNRGVDCGKEMEYVSLSTNNVWGGRSKKGGSVSSYEKIGYHSGSVDFIAGVLSTDCPVNVAREDDLCQIVWHELCV